ncbi:MAG TPA: hypothetical protein VNW99_03225 [Cytophagaceae bacterium]|nr:hypothetical protein [Cytophagaceae bacterium]
MKNIFKLPGLLFVAIIFFSSCSRNNVSDSAFQQERLIKLSAELEQNYSSPGLAAGSIEKTKEAVIQTSKVSETVRPSHSSVKKELSGKANPIKGLKSINSVKKAIKEYKKANPEQISKTQENNKLNLSQNMKTGIILIIIGLLVAVLSPISYLFAIVGSILIVVGLIFILIDLLDL